MKINVAVLRGGPSLEYDASLKTGAHILSLLRHMEEQYEPIDIFISKEGEWHREGLVRDPYQALQNIDVVWNGMHGAYGEDGQVQRLLESLQLPYVGAGAASSALSFNKDLAKKYYELHAILTPRHEVLREELLTDDHIFEIFRNYLHPVMIKPATSGSSLGSRLAHSYHELKEAIKNAFTYSPKVLVEEYIKGKDATCGVIENFRGEKLYALLPSGNFAPEEKARMVQMARVAHEALGLRHYSSSDFVVTPRGRVYILETDSLPNLNVESNFATSLGHTGVKPHEFAAHCISLALKNN